MDFDEQVGVSLVMLKGYVETDIDSTLGTGCKLNLGAQLHVFVFPLLSMDKRPQDYLLRGVGTLNDTIKGMNVLKFIIDILRYKQK